MISTSHSNSSPPCYCRAVIAILIVRTWSPCERFTQPHVSASVPGCENGPEALRVDGAEGPQYLRMFIVEFDAVIFFRSMITLAAKTVPIYGVLLECSGLCMSNY